MSHAPSRTSLVVANPAALAAYSASFDAGDEADVASLGFTFVYDPSSVAVIDNVTVINGPAGVGRWLRGVAAVAQNDRNRLAQLSKSLDPATGLATAASLVGQAKAYGCTGDGTTDDTAAFAAAIAACNGGTLRVSAGTYVLDTVAIAGSLTIALDDGATLKHKASSTNDMLVFTGTFLRVEGGTINGQQASQSYSRRTINAAIPSGTTVQVDRVRLSNTRASGVYVTSFGGQLDVTRCSFAGMSEHDGTTGHATMAVDVQSGQIITPQFLGSTAIVDPTDVGATTTQPTTAATLVVAFGATWNGGNVKVYGTVGGSADSEVFASNPGGTTSGTKVFSAITKITKASTGAADANNWADVRPNVEGRCRFNFNDLVGTISPVNAGGSPGGIFFAPTTDYAVGYGAVCTLDAEGNHFYGIGQNCAGNDIGPIHTYPTTIGVRVIGNHFSGCGFSAIAAKCPTDCVITGNVITNGQTSAQNDPTSGAIYYTPGDHAGSNSRPRAVISGNIIDTPGGSATVKQNGISVIGTPTSQAVDVIVSGNVIKGCGNGVWVDYATDLTIADNVINGSTGGTAGTEEGIILNHVVGTCKVSGNHLTIPNGYGIDATNVNSGNFDLSANYVKHTTSASYALILRGVGRVSCIGNTIDSTSGAVSITTDGSSDVGALCWDPSNVVIAGTVDIDTTHVGSIVGNYALPDFSHATVAGVTAAWDTGAQLTQAGGAASAWVDVTGALSLLQPTGNKQPAVVADIFKRRPALRGNGTSTSMTCATALSSFISGSNSFLYIVFRPITIARNSAAIYDDDGVFTDTNDVYGLCLRSSTGAQFQNAGGREDCHAALTLLRPTLVTCRVVANTLGIRIGNRTWNNVVSSATTPLTGTMRLFSGQSGTFYSNCDVGAVVIGNAALTYANDQRIVRSLIGEFGIAP